MVPMWETLHLREDASGVEWNNFLEELRLNLTAIRQPQLEKVPADDADK